MENDFCVIQGKKFNDDDNVITCSGLTVKQERDILSKSKYQISEAIYLVDSHGSILEQGEIEDKFYDMQEDGSIDYIYNILMKQEDGSMLFNGIEQSTMNDEGFYNRKEYINKFNKEPS